jgi:hypothetical protein
LLEPALLNQGNDSLPDLGQFCLANPRHGVMKKADMRSK